MRFGVSNYLILLAIAALFMGGCDDYENGDNLRQPIYSLRIPAVVQPGMPFPVVAMKYNSNPRIETAESVFIESSTGPVSPNQFTVKRGVGSLSTTVQTEGVSTIRLVSQWGAILAGADVLVRNHSTSRRMSGILSGEDLVWDSTAVIEIETEAVVPTGEELTVDPGTLVLLGYWARLIVEGEIHCRGTASNPVLFTSRVAGDPWGEIFHDYSSGEYEHVFLTGGGGDSTQAFGHSNSQPVFAGNRAEIQLNHVCITDCPGKAFGLNSSVIEIDSSLITRCDTGGEFHSCVLTVRNTRFQDIPCGDSSSSDDDNDALYIRGSYFNGETSVISRCVFVTGEDDGIDQNGAYLNIEDCVIAGFRHEGIAASNHSTVDVFNTLVSDCEQAAESGYGTPSLRLNHCTLVNNDIGLRFGDEYNWGCLGDLEAINTVSVNNRLHNVWNYDERIGAPREGAITITWSLVNDPLYDSGEGCTTGTPIFNQEWMLAEGSPGYEAAADGGSMGIPPFTSEP